MKRCSGANNIGMAVLRSFTEKKPDLCELLNSTMMLEEAQRISGLVEEMVEGIGDLSGESQLTKRLNQIGAMHKAAGVSISADMWNVFKSVLLSEIAGEDSEQGKLWSRLACFIIREFKQGLNQGVHDRAASSVRHR